MSVGRRTKPQVIAFYLPQFHPIPENDRWWGPGFTEWNNVRRARPLFPGHRMPFMPDDELGCYDLRDWRVLSKQAKLARRYGVEGFCFYHYWFDGRLLLQRPLELFLAHSDIDISFCLCWANEPWTRNWNGGKGDILIDQTYGDEATWISHFEWLRPYLEDPRALRLDGCPLLLIYRAGVIPEFNRMISVWRDRARRCDIKEIRILSVLGFHKDCYSTSGLDIDGVVEFHPFYALRNARLRSAVRKTGNNTIISYRELLNRSDSSVRYHPRQFPGVSPTWDNTARHRDGGATIFTEMGADHFRRQLTLQFSRLGERIPYLFVNAWNEWGEGCVLEPDRLGGRERLETLKDSIDAWTGQRDAT